MQLGLGTILKSKESIFTMKEDLKKFKQQQSYVSIRRSDLDDRQIQGYVLAYSNELVLIQYVADFRPDGLMILRLDDITSIENDKTAQLQHKILVSNGIYSEIDFTQTYHISDWYSVFTHLAKNYPVFSVEDEGEYSIFVIGKLVMVGEEAVRIREFTGAARWCDEITTMYFDDITCFQAGNHYAEVYNKYLESIKS